MQTLAIRMRYICTHARYVSHARYCYWWVGPFTTRGRLPCTSSLASQPYFSAYAHARAKVGGGREGKIQSGHTGQVFVAPTQDLELTNQIAATRKLHVN